MAVKNTPVDPTPAAAPEAVPAPQENVSAVQLGGGGMNKGLMKLIVTLVVVGALAIGGWVLADQMLYSPDRAFQKAQEQIMTLESFQLDSNTEGTYRGSQGTFTGSIGIKGGVDVNAKKVLDQKHSLAYVGKISGTVSDVTANFNFAAETRSPNGSKFYARVTELPALLTQGEGSQFKQFLNQWYVLSTKDLGVSDEDLKKCQPTDAQIAEGRKVFKDAKLFTNKKRLKSEKVGAVNARHYQAELDKAVLVETLDKVLATLPQNDACPNPFNPETKKAFGDALNQYLGTITVELWTGNDLVQWKVITTAKFEGDTLDIASTSKQTALNKSVTVEEPTGAKSFEELLGAFGGLVPMPPVQTPAAPGEGDFSF